METHVLKIKNFLSISKTLEKCKMKKQNTVKYEIRYKAFEIHFLRDKSFSSVLSNVFLLT